MQRTGRPSNALDAARMLADRAVRAEGQAHWDSDGAADKAAFHAWPVRDAEATAYAWLASSRRGPAWRSTRDTAAAVEALAEHARNRGVERAKCDVDVFVDDGAA